MSEYISLQNLLSRWRMKDFELLDHLNKGLQPFTRYGFPVHCPSLYSSWDRVNSRLLDKEDKLNMLKSKRITSYKLSFLGRNDPEEVKKIKNDFPKDIKKLRKELSTLEKNHGEKNPHSWKFFIRPQTNDEVKKLISLLKDSNFKTADVKDFEEKYGFGSRNHDKENGLNDNQLDSTVLEEATDQKDIPVVNFYKDGQKWVIGIKGKERTFDDLLGFKHIRFLLRHQGESFGPIEVYYCGNVPEKLRHLLYNKSYEKYGDKKTATCVKEHKKEKEEKLKETLDLNEKEKIEQEIEKLDAYLKESKKGVKSEKDKFARRVNRNIIRAIDTIYKVAEEFPSLHPLKKYLNFQDRAKTIITGVECSYRPNLSSPVDWILDPKE